MSDFADSIKRAVGPQPLFVDTSAILGTLEESDDRFGDFLKTSIYNYVTSTHVIAETVRRLVKTKTPNQFCGPGGEKTKSLAIYILNGWLKTYHVHVASLPHGLFQKASETYCTEKKFTSIQCDLTDIISFTFVRELEQSEIVSNDDHFRRLGLTCLP